MSVLSRNLDEQVMPVPLENSIGSLTSRPRAEYSSGTGDLDIGCGASALHDAVREARAAFRAAPSLWARYVHVGI
jgi:hypothetical protein